MAKRFHCTYLSLDGIQWGVEIYDDDFTGTSTAFVMDDPGGAEISWEGENNSRFNPVIPTACSIPFLVESATHFALITDLVAADEGRFTVKILKDSAVYWLGLIQADQVEHEDLFYTARFQFAISAVDGVARLEDLDYNNAGSAYSGRQTLKQHLYNVLGRLPTNSFFAAGDLYLEARLNWVTGAMSPGDDLLNSVLFDHAVFTLRDSSGNNEFASCYDILSEICSLLGARFFQDAGRWMLMQVNEFDSNSLTFSRYNKTGGALTADTRSIVLTLDQASDNFRLTGNRFGYLPGLSQAVVAYKHDANDSNLGTGLEWSNAASTLDFVAAIKYKTGQPVKVRVSGTIEFTSELFPTYTTLNGYTPHRLKFRMTFLADPVSGSDLYYKRDSVVNTNAWNIVYKPQGISVGTLDYCDIWSDLVNDVTDNQRQLLNFDFQFEVTADADLYMRMELETVIGVNDHVFNNATESRHTWRLKNPNIQITDQDDTEESSDENVTIYRATNAAAPGNSAKLKIDLNLGDGPNDNATHRLTDAAGESTGSWGVATDESLNHGDLLAREILAGQKLPVRKIIGKVASSQWTPNQKLATGVRGYVFGGGKYSTRMDEWNGEWWQIDYDSNDVTLEEQEQHPTADIFNDTTVAPDAILNPWGSNPLRPPRIPPPTPPNNPLPEPQRDKDGLRPDIVILDAVKLTTTSDPILAGTTITSIPVEAFDGVMALTGQTITVVRPDIGLRIDFEVAADYAPNDTSVSVVSKTVDTFLPDSSFVVVPNDQIISRVNGLQDAYEIVSGVTTTATVTTITLPASATLAEQRRRVDVFALSSGLKLVPGYAFDIISTTELQFYSSQFGEDIEIRVRNI